MMPTVWDEAMLTPEHPIHKDKDGGGEWDHKVQDPFKNRVEKQYQDRVMPSIYPPPKEEAK